MARWCLALSAAVGCATPCDDLGKRIQYAYDECGIPVPAGEIDGHGCAMESEEEGFCRSDCFSEADCTALDQSDPAAADALSACLSDCTTEM